MYKSIYIFCYESVFYETIWIVYHIFCNEYSYKIFKTILNKLNIRIRILNFLTS